MKKVKLLLDDLRVESFDVDPHSPEAGTVWGLQSGVHTECLSHCPTCVEEPCESRLLTHCDRDCPSWEGNCVTQPPPCHTYDGDTCYYTCATMCDPTCQC